MSQQACIEFPNAFYHVCSRGFNREQIFYDNNDYSFFLSLLYKAFIKYKLINHSYCLIPNHYHLFVQTPDANLSLAMKFINESYAKFFIKKYPNHDGYVFSRRYRRQVVQENVYAQNLLFYINGNAIKHEMVKNAQDWPWSSFNPLAGYKVHPVYLHTNLFNEYFNSGEQFAAQLHRNFDSSWSPELAAIGKTILGDDDFAKEIIDNYVDLNDENIIGRKEMTQHSQKMLIKQIYDYIAGLSLDYKSQENYLIYLLLEYTSSNRKELGTKFGLTANTLGQRASRVRKLIANNSQVAELLSPSWLLS